MSNSKFSLEGSALWRMGVSRIFIVVFVLTLCFPLMSKADTPPHECPAVLNGGGNACHNFTCTAMTVEKLACIVHSEIGTAKSDTGGEDKPLIPTFTEICKRVAKAAVGRDRNGVKGGINCVCPNPDHVDWGAAKRTWERIQACAQEAFDINQNLSDEEAERYYDGNLHFYIWYPGIPETGGFFTPEVKSGMDKDDIITTPKWPVNGDGSDDHMTVYFPDVAL